MTQQNFNRRSDQAEWMDSDNVSFDAFQRCLRDIAIVSTYTLGYRPTLHWLGQVLSGDNCRRRVSILDVGSGGGDMLQRIWKWAQRRKHNVDLTGVDLNPWSKKAAEEASPPGASIHYETSNIFAFDQRRRVDFVISSLFTHHLTNDEIVLFLRRMDDHATQGWFINDLHRHPLPFFLIKQATRILKLDPMVQHDGPVSVSRAFTADDWRGFLSEAGIPAQRVSIEWFFPFRYCLAGRKG